MDIRRRELSEEKVEYEKVTKSELTKRQEQQRKVALSSDSGTYIPHVYQVFIDPDFQQDIQELRDSLESLYYKDISLTISPSYEHLLLEDRLRIKEIADKYRITLVDLGFYADGQFNAGHDNFGRRVSEYGGFSVDHYQHEEYDGLPCYIIGRKTTLNDIEREWPFIRAMRQDMFASKENNLTTKTRTKSPENPQLIYAIFKARMSGKKFREIYEYYISSNLIGYSGNTNQFTGEDSLERYYRRHMPEVQRNPLISRVHEAMKERAGVPNDLDYLE